MKELSIEEKAKAYDKVLEWATEAHKVCDGMLKEDLEHLFPELKESEDEKIRKALIEYFNEQCDMSDWNGVYGYQVVAWLKSLRPQNTWKPSDEQMEALDRAQAELCSTEYNKPICDLIDALNKLK